MIVFYISSIMIQNNPINLNDLVMILSARNIMKQQLKTLSKYGFFFFCFFAIQACSGGSNDNGNPNNPGDPNNGYSISADTSTINARSEILTASTESFAVNVTFEGDGLLIGFAPNNSAVAWASYQLTNVTATTATLTVNIINTEFITAPGSEQTVLRLTTGNANTQQYAYHDVTLSLEAWQVSVDQSQINFTETYGVTTLPTQTLDIIASADWTISSNAAWLNLDVASGNGNQTVTLTANPLAVDQAGAFDGIITLTETLSGESKEIPVQLALHALRLNTSYPALSLYKLADDEKLSEIITITNNSASDVSWQASSNVNWLSTSIDLTNNKLTISKNATAVADGQNNGEITISSTTNGLAQTSIVYVGYYQSSNASSTVDLTGFTVQNVNSIAFDPSRPLIYLAGTNKITSYHLFTGAIVDTITTPMTLTNLAISPSGQYLLASAVNTSADVNGNNVNQLHVYKLDLSTNVITAITLPSTNAITYMPHFISQIDGQEIIITQAQEYATPDLSRLYWDVENAFFVSTVQQAANTNTVTYIKTTTSPLPTETSFLTYDINYNAVADNKITVSLANSFTSATYQNSAPLYFDIASTGNVIYTAQDDSEWLSLINNAFVENGVLYNTTETSSLDVKLDIKDNSYFYGGRITGDINQPVIFSLTKYDINQAQVWSQDITDGSGSSFIITNFNRFITFNTSNNTWFVTSFPN